VNATEAVMLLRKVKALCPSQAVDELTGEAWAEVLADIDYAAADEALISIVRQPLPLNRSRYIEPGHLISEARRLRRDRIERYGTPPVPADLDGDDYREYFTLAREAIGSGAVPPGQPLPPLPELRALAAQRRPQRLTAVPAISDRPGR